MDKNPAYKITEIKNELAKIIALMEQAGKGNKDKTPQSTIDAYTRLRKLHDKLIISVYKESGGTKCPFCNESSLDVDHKYMEGLDPVRIVSCRNCRKKWSVYFVLDAIKEDAFPEVDD